MCICVRGRGKHVSRAHREVRGQFAPSTMWGLEISLRLVASAVTTELPCWPIYACKVKF